MGIGAKFQSHKSKLNKETNDDTLNHIKNPGTPEGHRSMASNFNVIKKFGQKVSKKGYVYYDKHTDSDKNPYKKN